MSGDPHGRERPGRQQWPRRGRHEAPKARPDPWQQGQGSHLPGQRILSRCYTPSRTASCGEVLILESPPPSQRAGGIPGPCLVFHIRQGGHDSQRQRCRLCNLCRRAFRLQMAPLLVLNYPSREFFFDRFLVTWTGQNDGQNAIPGSPSRWDPCDWVPGDPELTRIRIARAPGSSLSTPSNIKTLLEQFCRDSDSDSDSEGRSSLAKGARINGFVCSAQQMIVYSRYLGVLILDRSVTRTE